MILMEIKTEIQKIRASCFWCYAFANCNTDKSSLSFHDKLCKIIMTTIALNSTITVLMSLRITIKLPKFLNNLDDQSQKLLCKNMAQQLALSPTKHYSNLIWWMTQSQQHECNFSGDFQFMIFWFECQKEKFNFG